MKMYSQTFNMKRSHLLDREIMIKLLAAFGRYRFKFPATPIRRTCSGCLIMSSLHLFLWGWYLSPSQSMRSETFSIYGHWAQVSRKFHLSAYSYVQWRAHDTAKPMRSPLRAFWWKLREIANFPYADCLSAEVHKNVNTLRKKTCLEIKSTVNKKGER